MKNVIQIILASLVLVCSAAQSQEKLSVFFDIITDDSIGMRVGHGARESLRRSGTMVLADERRSARMWFDVTTIKISEDLTSYSLIITVNDPSAMTGQAYWNSNIGYCGTAVVDRCTQTIAAILDQAAVQFRAQMARRGTGAPAPKRPT